MAPLSRTPRRKPTRVLFARPVFCVLLVLAATAIAPHRASAAGCVATHRVIAERAFDRLDPTAYKELRGILRENWGTVLYGAVFPDWGMPAFQDLSEKAHDTQFFRRDEAPRFRVAMIRNLKTEFGRARNASATRRAVAFLFGVIAHQEADYPWHNAVDGSECFETQGAAEVKTTTLDFELAADQYSLGHFSPEWSDKINWSIPDKAWGAVLDGYEALGVGRSVEAMLRGAQASQAGVLGAERAGVEAAHLLNPHAIENKFPWLRDNIEGYAAGGLNDCAHHAAQAWMQTWNWLTDHVTVTTAAFKPAQPAGKNGWNVSPVTVWLNPGGDEFRWPAEYVRYALGGSPAATRYVTTVPFTVTLEGATPLAYYSIDAVGGVQDLRTQAIKIDSRPPVVTLRVEQPRVTRDTPVRGALAAYDPAPGSGIASFTLNGAPTSAAGALDPFWWALGDDTLLARAEDAAGWSAEASQQIELYATIESLQATVDRLCRESHLREARLCQNFSATLDAARRARNRGDAGTAAAVLKARLADVKTQQGKGVAEQVARLLRGDLQYALGDLQRMRPGQAIPQ